MLVIIYMFLHLASSNKVILSPESIVTDAGTDSVNFTCKIQLETTTEHWITWLKDGTHIVENDTVLSNSAKYKVYGISSAALTEYAQTLQVTDIEETDHGIYTCILVFTSHSTLTPSNAWLIIRNIIPQPICFMETREQQVTLVCTISPSDPPVILYWADNDGKVLALESQKQNESLTLILPSINFESSNQLLVCGATIGFTYTNKCIIGNQFSTTMMPTTDIQTVTEKKRIDTTSKVTQEILISSGDKKATTITIIAVAGVIFITVFIILVFLKKRIKKRKNEEGESPEEGIDTNNGNQLTSIELGDGQLDEQCFSNKSSAFETDTDDPVNFHAPADLKNFEKSQKHVAINDNKKANDTYPLEYNGYKKESVPPITAEKPLNFKTDDKRDAVTSPSQNKDPNTNGEFHLLEENVMYVSAEEVTITQRNTEKADGIFNTACLNKDGMEGNSVTSQNDANTNDDPYPMEENKMYVSADEVKSNQRQQVMHYQAESGDIYAGVVKS